jgi:hypothetical protein
MFMRKGSFGRLGRPLAQVAGCLLAMVLCLGVLGGPAFGQNDDGFMSSAPNPPPEPNPVQIEVARGHTVEITLSAYSLTSPIIRFRIRRLPKGGKLSAPRMTGDTTGLVRYTPPAGYGAGRDSFSYQVQSSAGFSAPADVQITITDTDPQLITPGDLEFGHVLVGGSATRDITVQNIGGGLAEGTVQVPDPWVITGDSNYSLPGGQKQTFTILFAPTKISSFTGDIEYTGNPDRATDMNGEAVGPIGLPDGPIEMTQSGAMRSATVEIENRTNKTQTLKITPGTRLDSATSIDVPANKSAPLDVRAKGGDGELTDHLVIEGQGIKADLQVHAAALASNAVPTPEPSATPDTSATSALLAQNSAPQPDASAATPTPSMADAFPQLSLTENNQSELGIDIPPGVRFWKLQLGRAVDDGQMVVGTDFKGAPPAKSYRLEGQILTLDNDGRTVTKWIPLNGPILNVRGTAVAARLDHLMPGGHYVVRLVGLDEQGHVVEFTNGGAIWTLKKTNHWTWLVIDLAGGLAFLGAVVWGWRRAQRRIF